MNTIRVDAITSFCLSEQDGKTLRELVINKLERAEKVTVDFSNLSLFASPFFNASLGYILSSLGEKEFRNRIIITNLSSTGMKIFDKVMENVLEYNNTLNKNTISKIVNNIEE